jgi:amino acid transporter
MSFGFSQPSDTSNTDIIIIALSILILIVSIYLLYIVDTIENKYVRALSYGFSIAGLLVHVFTIANVRDIANYIDRYY